MKRNVASPQGQSSSSNKRPRIQNEEDFQQEFARVLDVPDFPAEPPLPVPGPESLFKVPSSDAENEIERLLGLNADAEPLFANGADNHNIPEIPKEFMAELKRKFQRGELNGKVLDYYSDVLPQGDSSTVPGQGGRALLLKSIMRQEDTLPTALVAGPTWRPVRPLGKGGFGEVMLWERIRKNGPPIRIATKESRPHNFFKDYCSEAHLTRRLNDLKCKNVINVVEWAYIEERYWRNEMGRISKSEPRHRICYEYADYGDLFDLISWYHMQRLILPEGFLWHVFHSIANALCYCCYGTNKPSASKRDWDGIVHMDLKPENMLLATPDLDTHRLYPCIKLADFGLAHTMGVTVDEIRYFKSVGPSLGTQGYVAPEVVDRTPEQERRRRRPHELVGPHCDVYSLGRSIENATDLLGLQYETFKLLGDRTLTPDNRPKLELVYTSDLWNLMFACQNEDARYRPKLSFLYKETKSRMEYWRALAQVEEDEASSKGIPGCFHNSVLYRGVDRNRYETDPIFRSNYRKANLAPVWELFGPLPSQNVMQSDLDANPPDAARFDGPKVQQGVEAPAYGETKAVKKGQERRKKGPARKQGFIRGLLSRMNIFS